MKCRVCGTIIDFDLIGQDRVADGIINDYTVQCCTSRCTWKVLKF